MSRERIEIIDRGRSYTYIGKGTGWALACFVALSSLRTIRGLVFAACGTGGIGFAVHQLFF
ncbi:MAG: hypothetical protein JWQ52_488 [Phenylobacterium sp.]|jgi:hypothetical protein|nr:hypothetical protein [Phenylobacterium sp.]